MQLYDVKSKSIQRNMKRNNESIYLQTNYR